MQQSTVNSWRLTAYKIQSLTIKKNKHIALSDKYGDYTSSVLELNRLAPPVDVLTKPEAVNKDPSPQDMDEICQEMTRRVSTIQSRYNTDVLAGYSPLYKASGISTERLRLDYETSLVPSLDQVSVAVGYETIEELPPKKARYLEEAETILPKNNVAKAILYNDKSGSLDEHCSNPVLEKLASSKQTHAILRDAFVKYFECLERLNDAALALTEAHKRGRGPTRRAAATARLPWHFQDDNTKR